MNRKAAFSYGCILMAAALWGGIGISVRYIAGFGLTSIQSACVRIFVTTLCLFLYLVCTDSTKLKIHLCDLKYYFGSGILSILLNNVCYAVSVRVNSLSMAAILLYTSPFIVVILAHFVFREKMTVKKTTALFICFIGCIFTVGLGVFVESALTPVGLLAGLGSALGYALYNLFTKVLVKKYHTFTVTFYTFLFALVGIVFLASPFELLGKVTEAPERIPLAVLSAALTSALPYLLFAAGLRYAESSKASIVATVEVAASSIFGFVFYGEKLKSANIIGILMIITAVVTLNLPEKRKKSKIYKNSIDKNK